MPQGSLIRFQTGDGTKNQSYTTTFTNSTMTKLYSLTLSAPCWSRILVGAYNTFSEAETSNGDLEAAEMLAFIVRELIKKFNPDDYTLEEKIAIQKELDFTLDVHSFKFFLCCYSIIFYQI